MMTETITLGNVITWIATFVSTCGILLGVGISIGKLKNEVVNLQKIIEKQNGRISKLEDENTNHIIDFHSRKK